VNRSSSVHCRFRASAARCPRRTRSNRTACEACRLLRRAYRVVPHGSIRPSFPPRQAHRLTRVLALPLRLRLHPNVRLLFVLLLAPPLLRRRQRSVAQVFIRVLMQRRLLSFLLLLLLHRRRRQHRKLLSLALPSLRRIRGIRSEQDAAAANPHLKH